MPVNLRDILEQIARQDAQSQRVLGATLTPGETAESSGQGLNQFGTGLGSLFQGLAQMKLAPEMLKTARENEKLNQEMMRLNNEFTQLQIREKGDAVQKLGDAAASRAANKYLLAGEDPTKFLPQSMLERLPMSVGAGLLSSTGDLIYQSQRVTQVRDTPEWGKIQNLPNTYKAAFIPYERYVADPETMAKIQNDLADVAKWQGMDRRSREPREPTPPDPNTLINTKKGQMLRALSGIAMLGSSERDMKVKAAYVQQYNELAAEIRGLKTQVGDKSDTPDLPSDFLTRPQAAQTDWLNSVKGWFTSKPTQAPPPPTVNNPTGERKTAPPPAVGGAPPPVKPPETVIPQKREGESWMDYSKRLPEAWDAGKKADAVMNQFPDLVR